MSTSPTWLCDANAVLEKGKLYSFSKESYVRNIGLFSRGDLPFKFEMTADEFFQAWNERKTCADVLGRPY